MKESEDSRKDLIKIKQDAGMEYFQILMIFL